MLRIKFGKLALVWRPENRPHGGRRLAFAFLLLATLVYAGVPYTFKDGDTLSASQLNANFAALAEVTAPVGTIVAFAGSTAPAGWLLCDGTQISRSTYATLYGVIANAYGSGDGSTSFHLPDLRGRFLRGVDGSAGIDPDKAARTAMNAGGATGNNAGSVQGHEFRSHNHSPALSGINYAGGTYLGDGNTGFSGAGGAPFGYGGTPFATADTGGNETRPVNAYVNFIIKY